MATWLATQGHVVHRKRVRRLMRLAGLVASGDLPAPEHEQAGSRAQDLPLSAGWALNRAGQSGLVLGRHLHPDGQGLPPPGGDHGLGEPCRAGVAAVEHARRGVLCRALEEALSQYGRPEIFNTDQGRQFTSNDFTRTLKRHAITISMDGKGRYMDNIFVERQQSESPPDFRTRQISARWQPTSPIVP
jgi:putative transposase